ncbi:MAG: carboxypeptidase-like regulatory domain-containing protein [Candidatus Omnitrophica bacterium]|nr:carboxypeptidase-like regulatory domain-containing protein [Candidatus Omnitrophota bacterium]MDD5353454.1 carboxypeptidase-like regulatory domain-containing protein [Candidatus Omnitrophota bacterium]MDD5551448.1 carboxypeptidase-like regulatory domain-containing protein [Candidatus Omnitrophota bacterium]
MKLQVLLLVVAVILGVASGCAPKAPNFNLSGTVTDAVTDKPIKGAVVSDDNYGPKPWKSALTDATGKYSYMTWGEEHKIIAQAPGYKLKEEMLKDNQKVLDFKLTRGK